MVASSLIFGPKEAPIDLQAVTIEPVGSALKAVEAEPTPRFVCRSCSPIEQKVLNFFQDQGVTDRNALATLMGNIKSESNFHVNICEGGARVAYQNCHRGGFGLIQWTTLGRYNGLGNHTYNLGISPTSAEGQLSWLVAEREWKSIEHIMKTPGGSINHYMRAAYRWLGWGIKGYRASYAHQYYSRFTFE